MESTCPMASAGDRADWKHQDKATNPSVFCAQRVVFWKFHFALFALTFPVAFGSIVRGIPVSTSTSYGNWSALPRTFIKGLRFLTGVSPLATPPCLWENDLRSYFPKRLNLNFDFFLTEILLHKTHHLFPVHFRLPQIRLGVAGILHPQVLLFPCCRLIT